MADGADYTDNILDANQLGDASDSYMTPMQQRLKAEDFSTEDLNGVTEGASSSGNMNYLLLQAQQGHELENLLNVQLPAASALSTSLGSGGFGWVQHGGLPVLNDELASNIDAVDTSGSLDSAVGAPAVEPTLTQSVSGDHMGLLDSFGVGNAAMSDAVVNGPDLYNPDFASLVTNIDNSTGGDTIIGGNPTNIVQEIIGDVTGTNPVGDLLDTLLGGGDPTDTDLTLNVAGQNLDLGTAVNLDPVENLLGDIDLNIGTGLLGGADGQGGLLGLGIDGSADNGLLSPVMDTVDSLLGNVQLGDAGPANDALNTVGDTLQGATDLLGNVLDAAGSDTPLADVTSAVTSGAESLLSNVSDSLGTLAEPVTDTASNIVQDTTGLVGDVLDATGSDTPIADAVTAVSDGVNSLTGDVSQLTDSLLGSGNTADTDLTAQLGDINLGVNLDPVEQVLGNIDLGVSATPGADGSLLGLDTTAVADNPILSPVTDAVDSLVDNVQVGDVSTVTDTLGTITDAAADTASIVGDVLDASSSDTPVDAVTSAVTDGAGSLTDNLGDGLTQTADDLLSASDGSAVTSITDAVGDVIQDTTSTVSDVTDALGSDAPVADTVAAVTDDVTSTVGDVSDSLSDTLNQATGDLLGGSGADPTDTDLSVQVGSTDLNVNLDPVEQVVGDIDLGLTADNSDSGGLLDVGVTGSSSDGLLDAVSDAIPEVDLGSSGLLDPAGTTVDSVVGGTGDSILDTSSTLGDLGLGSTDDVVGDLLPASDSGALGTVDGAVGGLTDALPEPLGSSDEGLGSGDTLQHALGGLQGLFG